ncbi:MAG: hypothetical protein NTX04_09180 [Verrucomicrobia bacterium]|nr:hypothetical protein [Verrucomicrobiota bacterium]
MEAVNHFFKAGSPSFVVPGINFLNSTPAGREDPKALDTSPPFKFWLCSHEKPLSKGKATPQINLAVTNAIVSQLQSNATIAGRPLAPSDFAVLTKTNYEAKELHAKLSAAGLPAIVMGSASVLQSEEARELLAILHAISNPTREDFLRAALATITLGYNSPSIHDLSTDLPEWESILADFSKHHQDWLKHGFAPAFRRFLITWQVRPRLLAFFDGERRLTNLLHLAELLHEAAISQDLGPASLPTWLATQMDPQTKTTDAHEQRLESDEAAVKVVTVHKSKGLEFNLVWVPFSWTNADPRKNAPVVFHNPQNTLTLDLGSLDLEAHHAILAQELLAEDARLLYVALTRAKLQCNFIWGRFYQSEVSAANWILHPPSPNPASAVADLRNHKLDDATFRSQISHLVDSHPNAFSATDLPPLPDPPQPWTPPPTTKPPTASPPSSPTPIPISQITIAPPPPKPPPTPTPKKLASTPSHAAPAQALASMPSSKNSTSPTTPKSTPSSKPNSKSLASPPPPISKPSPTPSAKPSPPNSSPAFASNKSPNPNASPKPISISPSATSPLLISKSSSAKISTSTPSKASSKASSISSSNTMAASISSTGNPITSAPLPITIPQRPWKPKCANTTTTSNFTSTPSPSTATSNSASPITSPKTTSAVSSTSSSAE